MNWVRTLSSVDIAVIVVFMAFYSLYLTRVIRTARALQSAYIMVFVKLLLRSAYFILLLLALLGPSFGESKREIKSVGKDIFMAVDLSQSMNAHDIQPTRLEKIKFELKKIVEEFNSDRIGLIIFSSEAFMQCPLTYDQNALRMFIDILHTGLVPNAGTDFAPPLKMALEKLNSEEGPLTQQKSKVIIFISDGEDFGDNTQKTVEQIENSGIRLFPLGVGTEKGSRIRLSNGFKKDREGNEVVTKLSAISLKKLASDTNGEYFEINGVNNDVDRLINTIKGIEGELRDVRQIDVSTNKYLYFLSAALLLILLDAFSNFKVIQI